MSVHDVGDGSLPFQPGMVIAVEPIVEDASKQLHVRIEDTVLITARGPEILTSACEGVGRGTRARARSPQEER